MEIVQSIFLGIVEGLTEFLPISSTGHLIVAEDFIGYHDASKLFTVVVQMGAIGAVMLYYRHELWQLIKGLFGGDKKVQKFWTIWLIATIPAGVFGLLFNAKIEASAVTLTVAIALILGGLAILLIEKYCKISPNKTVAKLDKITTRQALMIGFYQVLALIPGVSRSGATIMGGLISGVDRLSATAFSFYLGIPVILLAGTYKLLTDSVSSIQGSGWALLAGTIASFVSAFFVVGWLLRYVSRNDFRIFAYYRIVFGLVLLGLIGVGVLG